MPSDERFSEFYDATKLRVLHYLYFATNDLAEAEELTQDAYLRAWQHWDRVEKYDDPLAWVRTVGWRLAVNKTRWVRRRVGWSGSQQQPGGETDAVSALIERLDMVHALRTLPVNARQVLALYYLYDLSVEAIASELHIPQGTVKSRLSRGRNFLALNLMSSATSAEQDEPQ